MTSTPEVNPLSESNDQLKRKIERVREISRSSLIRFSNLDAGDCKESYLLDHEHFCGMRITAGIFQATWYLTDSQISFTRDGQPISTASLDQNSVNRAA